MSDRTTSAPDDAVPAKDQPAPRGGIRVGCSAAADAAPGDPFRRPSFTDLPAGASLLPACRLPADSHLHASDRAQRIWRDVAGRCVHDADHDGPGDGFGRRHDSLLLRINRRSTATTPGQHRRIRGCRAQLAARTARDRTGGTAGPAAGGRAGVCGVFAHRACDGLVLHAGRDRLHLSADALLGQGVRLPDHCADSGSRRPEPVVRGRLALEHLGYLVFDFDHSGLDRSWR